MIKKLNEKETSLVEDVENVKLDDSNTFQQEEIQSCSYLSEYSTDDLETQSEDAKNQTISISTQLDMRLNELENKAKNLRDRDHFLAY